MKVFRSESLVDYSTYTFNYAFYCLKEAQTELPEIYAQGFLPYSSNTQLNREVFYQARSLRVELDRFVDTSENRRVNRKMADLPISCKWVKKTDFDIKSSAFLDFCVNYAQDRFSGNAMDRTRFEYVLSWETASHLLIFEGEEGILGYVLTALEGNSLHYWYAFFDTKYMKSHSLGKWMMWKTISLAKEMGLDFVYLGTCYNTYALYKVRDHKGLAFFDGSQWNQNMDLLKSWCKTDAEPKTMDRFKTMDQPEAFLESLPA